MSGWLVAKNQERERQIGRDREINISPRPFVVSVRTFSDPVHYELVIKHAKRKAMRR